MSAGYRAINYYIASCSLEPYYGLIACIFLSPSFDANTFLAYLSFAIIFDSCFIR